MKLFLCNYLAPLIVLSKGRLSLPCTTLQLTLQLTLCLSFSVIASSDFGRVNRKSKANKALQRELLDYAKGFHAGLEKADRDAYFKLESSGNPFLDAIALWKQMAGGGSGGGQQGGQGGNPQPMTQEEVTALTKTAEDSFKTYGVYPSWDPLGRKPN